MLNELITDNYHGADIDWWLWLIKKVVYNRPESTCERHGDIALWDKLPPNKSLFTSNGKGLPIGNLTSQIFANLYMSRFDHWAKSYLGSDVGYGRFVDDFICIGRDKKFLLSFLHDARIFLKEELHLTLHPKKVYLQEAKKGVLFTGTYIKPGRTYTGNRTVHNAFAVVKEWNDNSFPDDEKYVQRMNSYLGFMIHSSTYAIRCRLWNDIRNKDRVECINMRKLQIKNKTKNKKTNELRNRKNRSCYLQRGRAVK